MKSKGLSEEIINSHAASENIFAPKLSFMTKKFEEKHLNKAKYQLVKKKGVTFLLLMLLDTWAKDVNTYLIPSAMVLDLMHVQMFHYQMVKKLLFLELVIVKNIVNKCIC